MTAPVLEAYEPVTIKDWFVCVDGIAVKQMHLEKEGWAVKQHRHKYDHLTMLAKGRMRVWIESQEPVDYTAPCPIVVRAMMTHTMLALEDDTVAYCIHHVRGPDGEIEVLPEG